MAVNCYPGTWEAETGGFHEFKARLSTIVSFKNKHNMEFLAPSPMGFFSNCVLFPAASSCRNLPKNLNLLPMASVIAQQTLGLKDLWFKQWNSFKSSVLDKIKAMTTFLWPFSCLVTSFSSLADLGSSMFMGRRAMTPSLCTVCDNHIRHRALPCPYFSL